MVFPRWAHIPGPFPAFANSGFTDPFSLLVFLKGILDFYKEKQTCLFLFLLTRVMKTHIIFCIL